MNEPSLGGEASPAERGAVVTAAVGDADLASAMAVRYTVFVDEQGVPADLERDARDATAEHFVVCREGVPVGAVRLIDEPAGFEGVDPAWGPVAHLGRLAVLPEARGAGLGVLLVAAVEARAAQRRFRVIYLGAQSQAVGFYERLGYHAYGGEFDDAGLPHRHMLRVLPG